MPGSRAWKWCGGGLLGSLGLCLHGIQSRGGRQIRDQWSDPGGRREQIAACEDYHQSDPAKT